MFWNLRFVSGALTAMVCILGTAVVKAEASVVYPLEPILRLELGSHTDDVKQLTPVGSTGVLTVSDDKTARLWNSSTGALQRVFRLPIGAGFDGQLYAVAAAPDGRHAVVGGYLRPALGSASKFMLAIFALQDSQQPPRLVDGFEAAVQHLAFSPNGRWLAVCLGGGFGLLVMDWPALQRGVPTLLTYDRFPDGDEILGADFAPNGDLALTMSFGSVRLYRAAESYGSPRAVSVAGVPRPMRPRFSPDGSTLAFGSEHAAVIGLIDVQSLQLTSVAKGPAADDLRGLYSVEWSADGKSLYTGGEARRDLSGVIYRIDDGGRGAFNRVLDSTRRLRDLARLPDGALAFVTGEPDLGVLEPGGAVRWRSRSPTISVRTDAGLLRASSDGSTVQLSAGERTPHGISVDIMAPVERVVQKSTQAAPNLSAPVSTRPGWELVLSEDREHLALNGRPVPLERIERVLDHAFPPDSAHMVLGTSFALRRVRADGVTDWFTEITAEVDDVTVSGDGRWVIAALTDGTVRWYRYQDGVEVLALLPLQEATDWVAWIPSGYYMSSVNGDNLIGWHLNNGLDQTPDFYRAIQFERVLYRPDVVREYFRSAGRTDVRTIMADANAFRIDDLRGFAPPQLQVNGVTVDGGSAPVARFTLTGVSKSLAMQDYTVFVNDVPVTPRVDRKLAPTEARTFSRNLEVPLTSKQNQIRVEAFNGESMGVVETVAELTQAPRQLPPGDLYLVAIGVNDFADPAVRDLQFAAQDAEALAKFYAEAGVAEFANVHVRIASDRSSDKPTREKVESLLSFVRAAGPRDTVIVFLASHGLSDRNGVYYFVPSDVRMADITSLDAADSPKPESLIPWQVFFDEMRGAAGRRLLIVDTCSAGDMRGTLDVHTLAKRSAASKFALVAASKGNEKSQEYPARGHGLFTYGLLEALNNGADGDGDGQTTLREAFAHAIQVVRNQRPNKNLPQTPQLEAPPVLESVVLASGARSRGAGLAPVSPSSTGQHQ